jgi:hypothetical protein
MCEEYKLRTTHTFGPERVVFSTDGFFAGRGDLRKCSRTRVWMLQWRTESCVDVVECRWRAKIEKYKSLLCVKLLQQSVILFLRARPRIDSGWSPSNRTWLFLNIISSVTLIPPRYHDVATVRWTRFQCVLKMCSLGFFIRHSVSQRNWNVFLQYNYRNNIIARCPYSHTRRRCTRSCNDYLFRTLRGLVKRTVSVRAVYDRLLSGQR